MSDHNPSLHDDCALVKKLRDGIQIVNETSASAIKDLESLIRNVPPLVNWSGVSIIANQESGRRNTHRSSSQSKTEVDRVRSLFVHVRLGDWQRMCQMGYRS